MIFADTNILVYAIDPTEAVKREIAVGLLREHVRRSRLVISTQVLQEFYVTVTRRKLLPASTALDAMRVWGENIVVPATTELLLEAAALQQRHQLSYWDALIVQAAIRAGCSTLLTEDLQAGMRFGELEVVNPFASGVHEPCAVYSAQDPPPAAVSTGRRRTRSQP